MHTLPDVIKASKHYNTTQIGRNYGTMYTLPDVIKASMHACLGVVVVVDSRDQ